jgi:hypothetical protein
VWGPQCRRWNCSGLSVGTNAPIRLGTGHCPQAEYSPPPVFNKPERGRGSWVPVGATSLVCTWAVSGECLPLRELRSNRVDPLGQTTRKFRHRKYAGRPPLQRQYRGLNARVMLGPPRATNSPLALAGRQRISVEVLLLSLLLSQIALYKSFTINSMHGEGIEPPMIL